MRQRLQRIHQQTAILSSSESKDQQKKRKEKEKPVYVTDLKWLDPKPWKQGGLTIKSG